MDDQSTRFPANGSSDETRMNEQPTTFNNYNGGNVYGPRPQNTKQRPQSSNSMKIVLIVALALLAVAVVALTYFITKDKEEAPVAAAPTEVPQVAQEVEEVEEYYGRFPGETESSDPRFRSFDWLSERQVNYSDIADLSSGEMRILRNAIFAMHGYQFRSPDLANYFSRFSWYYPSYSNVTAMLSRLEAANVQFIKKYE